MSIQNRKWNVSKTATVLCIVAGVAMFVFLFGETDFRLPPLTIQPLVENAVKHGVCGEKNGGTVTLTTRREGENVIITVTDDGVGFDPQTAKKSSDDSHIGLVDVNIRLERIGATMTVESKQGQGTTVTVVLKAEGTAPTGEGRMCVSVGG